MRRHFLKGTGDLAHLGNRTVRLSGDLYDNFVPIGLIFLQWRNRLAFDLRSLQTKLAKRLRLF